MPQSPVPQSPDSDFDRATALSAVDGGFVTHLDPGWDVGGGVLNGGYLLSVVARAAVEVSPHAHPVALSASYLRAATPGPATLAVTPGPAGRTLQHGVVVLTDATGPAVSVQVTTATLADVAPEHAVPPPAATPVEECFSVAEHAHLSPVPVPGISRHVETRLDPLTAGWALGEPGDEPVIRAWVRFADGREPDPLGLVAFTDVLPPTSWATGRLGWAPTVQLQTLVRALPAPGWCLVEARGGETSDGWVDEDYRVWDATGRLVAQSRQLARVPR
ncbi:thioesterase family protein [Klenkia sp. LSe6-5]|uniref:Thioesterase family protein n=1 Tax=Klenkia sesuvii TaxID=3103137 RepID=A0ABU8DWF8_9ACTN